MATIMTFPNHPTNAKLPSRECIRSHSSLVVSFMSCSHHPAASPFPHKLNSRYLYVAEPYWDNNFRRIAWQISSSVDSSGLDPSPSGSSSGGTRLVRAIQALQTKIVARIKELRKNLPIKLLFFLVGFYCATAFATVIGQTGDWDILSAALAVAVVEGIGALMYRASFPLLNNMRSLITMFNYWKDIEEVINLISYMQIILQMCDPGAPLGDYMRHVSFWFIGFDTIFFEVWEHVPQNDWFRLRDQEEANSSVTLDWLTTWASHPSCKLRVVCSAVYVAQLATSIYSWCLQYESSSAAGWSPRY